MARSSLDSELEGCINLFFSYWPCVVLEIFLTTYCAQLMLQGVSCHCRQTQNTVTETRQVCISPSQDLGVGTRHCSKENGY